MQALIHVVNLKDEQLMAEKLNAGDMFPRMKLQLVGGGTIDLPDGVDAKYRIVLFYRGHW